MVKKAATKAGAKKPAPAPAKQSASKAVTKHSDKDLVQMMQEDAGDGFQQTRATDYAIPFLGIIQSLSPQRLKNDEKYIQGAEEGNLFNSVSNELFESAEIVPVAFKLVYLEWKDKQGGFVGVHERDSPVVLGITPDEKGKRWTKSGTYLEETAQYYVLILNQDTGAYDQAIISMKGTQLKKSRRWNSLMQKLKIAGPNGPITPPMYGHSYIASATSESNDQGSWYGWVIEPGEPVTDSELYVTARSFSKSVNTGQVKVNYEQAPDAGAPPADDHDSY